MASKKVYGDCNNCESEFSIDYTDMLTSKDYPEYCPFCSEPIDSLTEEFADDDEENEEW
jgi:hypothetical protein